MADSRQRSAIAVALTGVGYAAIAIAGLGFVSLATDRDVLGGEGLGQAPGAVGFAASLLAVLGASWSAVRGRPSYGAGALAAPAAVVAYVVGMWITAALTGQDALAALSVAGEFIVSWFGMVIAIAAALAGMIAVALVRTSASPPRWWWERDDD